MNLAERTFPVERLIHLAHIDSMNQYLLYMHVQHVCYIKGRGQKERMVAVPEERMKQAICLLIFAGLLLVSTVVAGEGDIKGHITRVDWPDSDVHTSATLVPWVYVQNDGTERVPFWVQFSVQDPTGKWIKGACSSGYIDPGKTATIWPGSVGIKNWMPRGKYDGEVKLFGSYCGQNKLDSVVKSDAFDVS